MLRGGFFTAGAGSLHVECLGLLEAGRKDDFAVLSGQYWRTISGLIPDVFIFSRCMF